MPVSKHIEPEYEAQIRAMVEAVVTAPNVYTYMAAKETLRNEALGAIPVLLCTVTELRAELSELRGIEAVVDDQVVVSVT